MVNKFFQCTSIILSLILVIVFAELPRNENSYSTSEQLLRSAKTDVNIEQKSSLAKKEEYATTRRLVANFSSFEHFKQAKKINKKTKKTKEKTGKISKHDFELLCDLVAAEAEDQPFEDERAVNAELEERSDREILFFTAGKYGKYRTHAYCIRDHFFCKK